MASADLREQLDCSVCVHVFTDPVNLQCGHNFCRDCIDCVLDTQVRSGRYSCPECRAEFQERPVLQRNITLRNIVEHFRHTQAHVNEAQIICTYCIHASVPAITFCLLCEAFLCNNHLKIHKKAPEHVLCDPTISLENRRCSIHNKVLLYYCSEDDACICLSCSLSKEHRGHQVEMLEEAFEKKKSRLGSDLEKLKAEAEEMEKRVRSLQERRRKAQEKADNETKRVTALFRDLRRLMDDVECRILNDISSQAEQVSHSYYDVIQQLNLKIDELSRKMHHAEKLCKMTDPMTFLQGLHRDNLCGIEKGDNEDRRRCDEELLDGTDLNLAAISRMLRTGLLDIKQHLFFYVNEATDIVLDLSTVHKELQISGNGRTATRTDQSQDRPKNSKRFQTHPQAMSIQSFSSGQHYWEVDVSRSRSWRIGMCYPSIDRKGELKSVFGCNNKSWGLDRSGDRYSARHDGKEIDLSVNISIRKVWIYLDYEAGQLSFYDRCHPVRHLHTFSATFPEPLHAAIYVWRGFIQILKV